MATLYPARVYHKRLRPKVHEFTYHVWALKIDLSEIHNLQQLNLLGGTSPLTLEPKDFGPRDGSDLLTWFQGALAKRGYDNDGKLELLFLPRFRGQGFAPITVWIAPDVLMFEVHNTAGEAHTYFVPSKDLANQQAWKRMWVSPFTPMHGRYDFDFAANQDLLRLKVRLENEEGPLLTATMTGKGQQLNHKTLKDLKRTPGVSGRSLFMQILWQGLQLRLKGLRPYWGVFAPRTPISTSQTKSVSRKS